MKTACKVFIIIGIVVGFFWIAPPIVGFIALDKLKTARTKSDLTAVGVCTLLFCSLIGGILMLCIPETELNEDQAGFVQNSLDANTEKPSPKVSESQEEVVENIEKLKKLKEQGVLSDKEYEMLRKREINKLLGD